MESLELVEASQVLGLGERTISELAAIANSEHRAASESARATLEHAFRAGTALIEAKRRCDGEWLEWLAEHFDGGARTAYSYERLATHRDMLSAAGIVGVCEGMAFLSARGLGVPSPRAHTDERREQARLLARDGLTESEISRELGLAISSVRYMVNPSARAKRLAYEARNRKVRSAERRALREQQREQAIRAAVRKAGSATKEAWAMAERMQDVLAQAQREIDDREAKRALSEAGVHYRKMRDEIVRALGVE